MPRDVDEDNKPIWRFGGGPQNQYSTPSNRNTREGGNWNLYLRMGTQGELAGAQAFVNGNDPANVYHIDGQSIQNHHHELRWLYILDTELYHKETSISQSPWGPLDLELWQSRLEELEEMFGVDDSIQLPVTGGVGKRGMMTVLIGTNPPGGNHLSEEIYAPIEKTWDFLQQYLIPGVSSIYMQETDPNNFTLFFEVFYERIAVARREDQDYGDCPRNWLWYGAPGNGKSHDLEEKAELFVRDNQGNVDLDIFPYSFSPATTYGDFIGEYRPNMLYQPLAGAPPPILTTYVDSAGEDIAPPRPGTPAIDYAFVPGIFIKALIRAYTIPTPVVLVIDEINRGDIYEILGEVFQLMERKDDGTGSYAMPLNQEAMNYLDLHISELLSGLSQDELNTLSGGINVDLPSLTIAELKERCREARLTVGGNKAELIARLSDADDDAIDVDTLKSKLLGNGKIRLPENFYLWGTMNPNDASVQQIDAAFFRRWVTKYIGIDNTAKHPDRSIQPLPMDGPLEMTWGDFRAQLNDLLLDEGFDEEELIGMWFLKNEELEDWVKFYSKLVFHLANNVLKMKLAESEIFTETSVREIMKICENRQSPFNPAHFPLPVDGNGDDENGDDENGDGNDGNGDDENGDDGNDGNGDGNDGNGDGGDDGNGDGNDGNGDGDGGNE
jgi:hypothetical protein